ncbi:MAG: type I-D CRISPR-associated protein Cas5/Csc1 [Promethearchaeota archaeon]
MIIYYCEILTLGKIFYASSEISDEYQTAPLIGNSALPYALKFIDVSYKQSKKPRHRQDFQILNNKKIYITPAKFIQPIKYSYEFFNGITENYDQKISPNAKNLPTNGKIRFISFNNKAFFYIISEEPIPHENFPKYIRLGKFMAKCKLNFNTCNFSVKTGKFDTNLILRAFDIPNDVNIISYKLLSIQHGPYLLNTQFEGKAIIIKNIKYPNENHIIPFNSAFYIAEQKKKKNKTTLNVLNI